MKTHYICPYCFSKHKINNVKFRCKNQRCIKEPDTELSTYEGGRTISMNKVITPQKVKPLIMPRSAVCPECNENTTKKICPSCHNELPREIDTVKDIIISIVGAKNTGKSHYIAVLIDQMRKISYNFNACWSPINTQISNRYKTDFYNPLFKSHKLLSATTSGMSVSSTARKPLIYELVFGSSGFMKKNNTVVYLTFFDTAGEDLDDEDVMNTVNKYISRSSGIIFLLDPLQIHQVRDSLGNDVIQASSATKIEDVATPSEIIGRVSNMIRDFNSKRAAQKIDVPVAATFTKIDAIESLLPRGNTIMETSPHYELGEFDSSDAENINQEIESMLIDWNGHDYTQQLSINYSKYSFFGASSLGKIPEKGNIDVIRPHRIEDPLLWLLALNNVIPSNGKG